MFFSVNLVRSFSFTLSPEVISWGVYFNLVLSDVENVESQKVLPKKTQRSSIGFCASKSHGFPLQPIKITRTGPGSKATVIKSWTNKSLQLDGALSSPFGQLFQISFHNSQREAKGRGQAQEIRIFSILEGLFEPKISHVSECPVHILSTSPPNHCWCEPSSPSLPMMNS